MSLADSQAGQESRNDHLDDEHDLAVEVVRRPPGPMVPMRIPNRSSHVEPKQALAHIILLVHDDPDGIAQPIWSAPDGGRRGLLHPYGPELHPANPMTDLSIEPMIFIARVRLSAISCRNIFAQPFGSISSKCVAPILAFIVPKGCWTVSRWTYWLSDPSRALVPRPLADRRRNVGENGPRMPVSPSELPLITTSLTPRSHSAFRLGSSLRFQFQSQNYDMQRIIIPRLPPRSGPASQLCPDQQFLVPISPWRHIHLPIRNIEHRTG